MLIKTIVLLFLLFFKQISCNTNIHYGLLDQYEDYNYDSEETYSAFPINNIESFHNEVILNCQRINDRLGDTCNCGYLDEVFTLPRFTDTNNYEINIINCKTLIIHNNTFLNLSFLKRIILTNIENLILEKDSFNVRRITSRPTTKQSTLTDNLSTRLSLTNVIIEDLPSHTISGSFESIEFNNCKIGIIRSYAITGINNIIYNFSFKNTIINTIEQQSIKKISCNYFEINNITFLNDLPSRCFYEIEVENLLKINNNNLQKVHSSAFFFQDVESFQLLNNKFQQVNGESIRMSVKNTINIRDNDFGSISNLAFSGIKANPSFYLQNSENIMFNFIANNLELTDGLDQRIIVDNSFNINLLQLYYKKSVTCADINQIKNQNQNNNNFFLNYADTIYFKMLNNNDNDINNTENIAENLTNNDNKQVSTSKILSNNGVYYALSYIINNKCIEETYLLYIIIGSVGLIVFLIIVLIIIICYVLKKRREKKKLNIIMPDGKTYRETQIIMQIENHGLLKTDL